MSLASTPVAFPSGNNLGFAIPIDTAKEVIKSLLAHGKVTRSYIGVQLQPLQDLEKFYDLETNKGVLVASIEKGSPAEKAGIKAEDILLSVNDRPVNARFPEQLAAARKLISDYPEGSILELKVRRGFHGHDRGRHLRPRPRRAAETPHADIRTVQVTTERLESTNTEERLVAAWGLTVRDLTRAYLRERRLPAVEGVLVTGTRPGSQAERAGLQAGDIILNVDDKKISSIDELETAVAAWEKNPHLIGVDISRDRARIPLSLKP